jgi:hypothetical protein
MIETVAQLCVAALFGPLTVLGLMIVFLALCVRDASDRIRPLGHFRVDFEIASLKCLLRRGRHAAAAAVTVVPPYQLPFHDLLRSRQLNTGILRVKRLQLLTTSIVR